MSKNVPEARPMTGWPDARKAALDAFRMPENTPEAPGLLLAQLQMRFRAAYKAFFARSGV